MGPQEVSLTLTFDSLHQHLNRYFIGPPWPISDYRIAAGLLFQTYNDRTTRELRTTLLSRIRDNRSPHIEITWWGERGAYAYQEVLVAEDVVRKLYAENVLEGKKEFGYTDMSRLRLNDLGKRRVVTEWFSDGRTLNNILMAGATVHLGEGRISWPS